MTQHSDKRQDLQKSFLRSQAVHARRALRVSSMFALLSGVLIITSAYLLSRIVSGGIFNGWAYDDILPYALGILVVQVARAACHALSEYSGATAALQIKAHLRRRMVEGLTGRSLVARVEDSTGADTTGLIEGLDALHGYYARYLPAMTVTVMLPLGILLFVLPVDTISAVVMLLTAPLIPFFMVLIGQGAERLNQRQWRKMAILGGYMLDRLQGMTTLRLLGASRREGAAIARMGELYRQDTMAVLRLAFLSSLALEFFATVSIAVVAVLLGFRLMWGTADFSDAYLVLLLAPEFYLPLRRMGAHYHARMEAIGAVERILPLVQEGQKDSLPTGSAAAPHSPPRLCFEQVEAGYGDAQAALRDISFTLPAGGSLALVGPSGSGKSTVLLLLLGFLTPRHGRILIDGMPLEQIDREQWWQRIGWVPQRPHLFWGDVAANIRLADAQADDGRLQALADELGIDFLSQDAREDGRGLSGGQVRRVALARALLKPRSLLLLDEPTAHLDPLSEERIAACLARHAGAHSRVTAAHRLGSIRQASHILVLSHGRMAGFGSHAALLADNAHYRGCIAQMEAL